MQRAVIKNALFEAISDPSVAEDVALTTELAELSVAKASKFKGTLGKVIPSCGFDQSLVRIRLAPLQLFLAVGERQIYRLGEFDPKNPALGLAEVHEDYVQLVDRYGKLYRLNLKD